MSRWPHHQCDAATTREHPVLDTRVAPIRAPRARGAARVRERTIVGVQDRFGPCRPRVSHDRQTATRRFRRSICTLRRPCPLFAHEPDAARRSDPRAVRQDARADLSLAPAPELPPVLHRPDHLQHGQLADQRGADAARAQHHRQRLAIGLLAACQFGPILVLSAWAGAIADRSDKRRLLLLTQSLEMAESVGLAVLAFMPHPPLSACTHSRWPAESCWPSTTRCGARSSPRWCRPRTSRTPSCSTAPSSTSRGSSGRRWRACSS